ncbi:MAG: histone H1, partial [Sphingobacteriales bacterium]
MEKFEKVKELVSAIEADATKFYDGGNAAAGTR